MRQSCHKLYDYMWSSVKKVRKNIKDKIKKDAESEQQFISRLKEKRFVKEEEFIDDGDPDLINFSSWFRLFYKKYSKRFVTCSRFVRMSNINDNRERHWFFSYISLFFNTERLGHIYICNKQVWLRNFTKLDGTRMFNQLEELSKCMDKDLDVAFDKAINTMAGRIINDEEHFRYITYDSKNGGSHQKIYSWVNFTGKRLRCLDSKAGLANGNNVFPPHVMWEKFSTGQEQNSFRIIK